MPGPWRTGRQPCIVQSEIAVRQPDPGGHDGFRQDHDGPGAGQATRQDFVDSDEEIIKRTGVTVPHIFDVEGESGFRLRETAAIKDLAARDNLVLATGGGAVLAEENRAALQHNGIVIYLKASVHDLWQRTRHDRNRPLLQTRDPHGRLTELFQQRDPLYQQVSDIVIQSGKQSVTCVDAAPDRNNRCIQNKQPLAQAGIICRHSQ